RSAVPGKAGQRSLSALTWAVRSTTAGLALDRHNLFFGDQYAGEFSDIFKLGRLPREPTVYVCAQDRGTGAAPNGAERLLCLVNAPAIGDTDSASLAAEAIARCRQSSLDLMRRCGLALDIDPEHSVCTTPRQFHQRFPGTGGALYGQATHGWLSIFSRPGSVSPVPGLYLAGGSAHPGPGVPMAAMSGRLAAEAILANRALTRRCHPVATSGGTSMPPAMTAHWDSP
ncbi:MAG: FAD-dependent oxidoreductase, partial [Rhodoferax sp.]|nr:FAD-dependent oxidoreductase [Rhodoferax sp.]